MNRKENLEYSNLNEFFQKEISPFFTKYNDLIKSKQNSYSDMISYLSGVGDSFFDDFYIVYEIKKKNGAFRQIEAPIGELKYLQKKFANFLLINRKRKLNVSFGFEHSIGIAEGAIHHINKATIINVDIKDFFRSISKDAIKQILKTNFDCNENLNNITEFVTYKSFLPTGAPTSPILSNYVCDELDIQIDEFAKRHNLTYTRYVDDLTFSSNERVNYNLVLSEIRNIIGNFGFKLNKEKTKIYKRSHRQEVTGLVVNEKVNLKRSFRYNLKAILYNWEYKGYHHAQTEFNKKFKNKVFLTTVEGWINFLGTIKGKEDTEYKNFKNKFCYLKDLLKQNK